MRFTACGRTFFISFTEKGTHDSPLSKLWVVYKERDGLAKRHEFRQAGKETDPVFVVFEGHEDTPFWNRASDGVRFVYTDLTYTAALEYAERGDVEHIVLICDTSEFQRYYQAATQKHKGTSW